MALWRSLRSGGQEPPTERKDAVSRRHSAGPYYQFSGAPYSPPLGDLDLDRAVESQWGRVVWVYRAIDARAKNLARLTVRVNTGRGKDALEIEDHPLAILLNRQANRYESGTAFRYRFSTLADLSKRGVFVEVVENNSGLSEVHLLNPKHTFPVPDPDKFVSGYHMRLPSGETFDLKPYKQGKGGVLWYRRPHPTDPYSSQTWLDAAGISIDLDHYARVYNRNFLANDGKPGGVLMVKSEEGVDDEVAAELQARFAGGPQQAGRVSVLEADDLEYVDMSTTPRDAQYVESRALSKGEILGAAGTPESLWNASGRTFDNADAELEGWWRNDMVPEAEAIASFWEQLTPGGAVDDTEVVSYAWEDITVLNRDEREQEARLQAEWAAGTISLDEYREKTGKDPLDLPGSRVVWLTAGKAPVGQPEDVAAIMGQGQEAPPPEGGETPPGGEPPPEGPPPENGPGEGTPPAGDSTDPVGDALLDTGDPVGDALLAETKALPSEVGKPDPFARQRAAQAALVDTWVNACSDEIATLLRRQEKVILSRLTGAKARKHTRHWTPKNGATPTRELKALDPEYIVDRRRWIDEVIAAIGDIVRAAFGAAGDRVLAALTGDTGFDPSTDAANEAVAKTVRIIAEGFDARAGRLQDVVAEGDAAGKTIDEIAADVQAAFTQAETWADVTSRQVVGAMNAAQQIAATDAGATRKRWLATDDERTRASHRDAEGQVVDITEPFQVGEGVLMFPGDPTGPIGEWINCRCTMLFQSPERDFDAELDADLAALDEIEAGEKALIGRAARAIAGSFGTLNVRFDPDLHPRDHRGRFVDTPDVILPDGSRGVAVGQNDNGTITVAKPTGAVVTVAPEKVTDPPKPKPKPAAPASFRPLTGGLVSANVAANVETVVGWQNVPKEPGTIVVDGPDRFQLRPVDGLVDPAWVRMSDGQVMPSELGFDDTADIQIIRASSLTTPNEDYRGSHQPPSRDDDVGASIVDMEQVMPDLYSRPNLYTSRSGDPDMETADREALAAITAARGKPDAQVTVYRAVPPGVDTINPGDWVSPSRRYAEMHARQSEDPAEDWPVISRQVRAADLLTHGDALHEFGWVPETADDLVSGNVYLWHGDVRTVPPDVARQGAQAVQDYLTAEDTPTMGDLVSPNVDTGQDTPIPLADLISASIFAEGDTSGQIPDKVGEVFDTWLGPATVTERGFQVTLNIEGRGPVTVEVTPPVNPENRRAGTASIVDVPSEPAVPVKSKANERLKAGDMVSFYDTETGQSRLGTVWSEAPVAGSGHKGSWWVVPAEPKPGEASAIVVAGRGKSDRQAPTTAVGPDELFHDPEGVTGRLTRAGAGSDTYPARYDGKPLSAQDRTVIDRIRNDLPLDKIPTNDLDAMARQGLIERRGGGFMGTADWVVVEQPRSTRERIREVLDRQGNIRGSLYNDLHAALYVSDPNDPTTGAVRAALESVRPSGWDSRGGTRWSDSVLVRDAVEAALAAPESDLISANVADRREQDVNPGDTPFFGTGDQATFSERLGNCYELSSRALVMGAPEGSRVVYGTIQGDGKPPLGHAWVELPNGNIWEPISHTVSDPDEFVLQFGAIPHQSYTAKEAATAMVAAGHHGPWYPVDDRGVPLDGAPTDEDRQQARAQAGRNLVAKITAPVDLVSENVALVEAGTFHPEDHPIDTFGNFQEAPLVRMPDGRTGMVTRRNPDGTVVVIGPDGESSDMAPADLTEVTEAGFRSDLLAPNTATAVNMRIPGPDEMEGRSTDAQRAGFRIYTAPDGREYLLQEGTFRLVGARILPKKRPIPRAYTSIDSTRGLIGTLSWFGGKIDRNEDGTIDDRSNINGGRIHQVFVKPEHRRNGVATALLQFARELNPDMEIRHSGALSDDGRAWSLVSPRFEDPGGFRGTLSVLAHGIMEAFQALDIGGVDDEPPGEVNVIAEVPAAPSNLPIPERFRARYRSQYLLAANATASAEALRRIPPLHELLGRADPEEADAIRAEHRRLYDAEYEKVLAEREAIRAAAQQNVLSDFDDLPEGVDPLHYMDAGADKPLALYGLSHQEAVALGGAGLAPGPGAVRDWVGGFSTWAVPAERLDDGDMVPFRGVTIQGRTIPFGYVTKIDGMPILVEAGTEDDARRMANEVNYNWKIATADVNSDLVLEATNGIAWTRTPLKGDPFGFSAIIATGGDGTITFWDFPPDVHTLRHESAHNIDNYDKRDDRMAPRRSFRDAWVETVVADREVFSRFLSITHDHWENDREASTDHPIVWELPFRKYDPIAHGADEDAPGQGLSLYGQASMVEDFAESAAIYLRDRYYGSVATAKVGGLDQDFEVRFADMHPHRARYFDRIYGLDPAPISELQRARLDNLTGDRGPISGWSENQLMIELRMHGIDPTGMSKDAMLEALADIPGVGMYMEA